MIHPNRMMETAMPMKPAVILRKSEERKQKRQKEEMKMTSPRHDSREKSLDRFKLAVAKACTYTHVLLLL